MATFHTSSKHDFNLEVVLYAFQKCRGKDGSLNLEQYLSAYRELARFFRLSGTLFSFVARDIESKIHAIEYHKNSVLWEKYYTVQSMVDYEISVGGTHTQRPHPSGCRTLLRLHHALEFILAFMRRLLSEDDHEKMSKLAWEVYSTTLCKHHPWFTQKLAAVAVYALPSKKQLIEIMCKHSYDNVLKLLTLVIEMGQPVYDTTENVLAENNLLYIP